MLDHNPWMRMEEGLEKVVSQPNQAFFDIGSPVPYFKQFHCKVFSK
jgi:hypothetical protein